MSEQSVESFVVTSDLVAGSDSLRLDATYYNRAVIEAVSIIESSGMDVVTVGDLAERVFIPNRFKRNYVDKDHGVPFLRGSHVVHFRPSDLKYLSSTTHTNMDELLVREGWILITRSGTVGRVAMVTSQWDGWAATEDIYRVVPRSVANCPPGYLATFLGSPLGQAQLTARVYGAVVDHLTEDHIRSVKVPLPATPEQRAHVEKIGALAVEAASMRARAAALAEQADSEVSVLLPRPIEPMSPSAEFEDALQTALSAPKEKVAKAAVRERKERQARRAEQPK